LAAPQTPYRSSRNHAHAGHPAIRAIKFYAWRGFLHACPEVVRDGYQNADWIANDRRDLPSLGMRSYTETGIVGRPSLGSPAKGKAVLDALVTGFARMLNISHMK
jgi:hypothetical protein